jgi:hypothetical protein
MNLTEYSYGEKAVCDIVAPSSALRITSKRHIKHDEYFFYKKNMIRLNHLVGGLVIRAWNQGVCSSCDLKFESYDY